MFNLRLGNGLTTVFIELSACCDNNYIQTNQVNTLLFLVLTTHNSCNSNWTMTLLERSQINRRQEFIKSPELVYQIARVSLSNRKS